MDSRPGINLAQEIHKSNLHQGLLEVNCSLLASIPSSEQPLPNHSSSLAVLSLSVPSFYEGIFWSSCLDAQYATFGGLAGLSGSALL